jgi:hypothetical protein
MNVPAALLYTTLVVFCATAQEQSTIAGRAIDSVTGQPLEHVHIRFTAGGFGGEYNGATAYGAMSDAEGHFSISPIAPGTYSMRPELRGYSFVPSAKNGPPKLTVTIKPGEQIADFRVELTARAILSGRVLDEHGEPVEGSWIRVRAASTRDMALELAMEACCVALFRMTNELGEFRIAVPPGRVRLFVSANSHDEILADGTLAPAVYATTEYPYAVDGKAAAAEARPGRETAGLDIRLVRKQVHSVTGTVTGAPSGAAVSVRICREFDANEDEGIAVPARKDGTFSISQLEPASYRIFAESGSGEEKLQSASMDLDLFSDAVNIGLVLKPPANLTGTVTGAAHASVILKSPNEFDGRPSLTAPESQDGSFGFDRVQPDRYLLTVRPVPEGSYIRSVELNGATVTERNGDYEMARDLAAPSFFVPLDLGKVMGSAELKIVVGTGARISGTVEGKSGLLTDGFGFVELMPAGNKSFSNDDLRSQIDRNGGYVIHGIPPGRYRVLATHPSESNFDDDKAGFEKMLAQGEIIEFHEGEAVTKKLTVATEAGDGKKNQ